MIAKHTRESHAMRNTSIVALVISVLLGQPVAAAEPCDRNCLMRLGDTYLNAMTFHDTAQIQPHLSTDLVMTENGAPAKPGDGLWATAKGFPVRQSFADPTSGQFALIGVALEQSDQRAHFGLRLKVVDRKISEIEQFVIRKGDHSLFDEGPPPPPLALWSTPVPASSILPRAKMIEIANDYYETLLRSDPRGLFSPDCDRVENGVQTSNNPLARGGISCTEGGKGYYGFIKGARGRRFPVVDEELGVVIGQAHLDLPGTVKALEIRGKSIAIPERNQVQRSSVVFAAYKIQYGQIRAIMARVREEPYLHTTLWDK